MAFDRASTIVPSCLIRGCFDIILTKPPFRFSAENEFSGPFSYGLAKVGEFSQTWKTGRLFVVFGLWLLVLGPNHPVPGALKLFGNYIGLPVNLKSKNLKNLSISVLRVDPSAPSSYLGANSATYAGPGEN
jgi:hypothetical protein